MVDPLKENSSTTRILHNASSKNESSESWLEWFVSWIQFFFSSSSTSSQSLENHKASFLSQDIDTEIENLQGTNLSPYKEAFLKILAMKQARDQEVDTSELEKNLCEALPKNAPLPEGSPTTDARAPVGLVNTGNDCFFNALLQMIFLAPELVELIINPDSQIRPLKQAYQMYRNAQLLGKSMELASYLRSMPCYLNIAAGQNDPHEAFLMMMNPFTAKSASPLAITTRTTRKYSPVNTSDSDDSDSDDIKSVKKTHPSEFCLQLQLKKGCAIEDLFEAYTAEEKLAERDKTETEIDNYQGKVKPETNRIKFVTPPKHFFINIKRYNNDLLKCSEPLGIGETFYLPSSCVKGNKGFKYELRSYAYHSGGTTGGHYWCNTRQGDSYYTCNDRTVVNSDSNTFEKGATQSHFLYAVRVDDDTSQEEINNGTKANKAKASEVYRDYVRKQAKGRDTTENQRLSFFIDFLKNDAPKEDKLETLQIIYDTMPDSFKKFVAGLLKTDQDDARKKLFELKDIEKKITTRHKGNIIEQYAALRKKKNVTKTIAYGDFELICDTLKDLAKLREKVECLKDLQKLSEGSDFNADLWAVTPYRQELLEQVPDAETLKDFLPEQLKNLEAEVEKLELIETQWLELRQTARDYSRKKAAAALTAQKAAEKKATSTVANDDTEHSSSSDKK
ncbi:ubiquitin carboxyl-terminal hydrolase [Candidatus Neptunochlamydia vexilliferae]|nr:ubiquitin carboxyl-terminal hydrolase family protein [Candidatus Neptunochlamydia vexilliferae]